MNAARVTLLGALLAALAAAQFAFAPPLGHQFADAAFYYQVARHVAEGDGLLTSVSLYNQGFRELPHPTNVYPLWPLLLGLAGRVVPLELAARLLPGILYLASLLLLYRLANRLAGTVPRAAPATDRSSGVVTAGHAAAAIFGLNFVYFASTAVPYAEGLGYVLVFGALLAAGAGREGGVGWPFLAGLLGGAALLTRSQFVGVLVAVPIALLLGVDAGSRRGWRALAACLGGLLPVAAFVAWLSTWMGAVPPVSLLSFDAYRETPQLAPFIQVMVPPDAIGLVTDRLRGLVTAFDPTSRESYLRSFGPVAWLVPVGAVAMFMVPRRADHPRGGVSVTWLATLLAGGLILVPTHLAHVTFIWDWLFGHRHGLPLILLLAGAGTYLHAAGGMWRRVAVVALLLSLAYGAGRVGLLLAAPRGPAFTAEEREMAAWFDSLPAGASALTTRPQGLALLTRRGLHWTRCGESAAQVGRFIDQVGVDYVIAYPGERDCPFALGAGRRLPVRREFGRGDEAVTVWGVR